MTDVATKSPKQIAHEQRNADAKQARIERRVEAFIAHLGRNNEAAALAAARRTTSRLEGEQRQRMANRLAAREAQARRADRIAAHQARNEAAALASATQAFAEAIERTHGIVANDNAALAKAA